MYREIIKNIEKNLSKDGCPQRKLTILNRYPGCFSKHINYIEKERKENTSLSGTEYRNIIDRE